MKEFLQYIDNVSCVATQPNLRIETLLKFTIPDFNLSIQNKIVDILSKYDDLIENNNKRIKLLEQMAENLYKEWFVRFRFPNYKKTKFVKGIPEDWKIDIASNLFDISIGKTPPRKEFCWFDKNNAKSVNWISISDMRNNMYILDTEEQLTQDAIDKFNVPIIPKNSIVLSFKLTVGKVAITTENCSSNEAIASFKKVNDILREYLYFYLKSFEYSKLGNTSSIGNAINSKIVRLMKIIIPKEEIILSFHKKVNPILNNILLLLKQNQNLIKQRDLLLPRLMSGKLEV